MFTKKIFSQVLFCMLALFSIVACRKQTSTELNTTKNPETIASVPGSALNIGIPDL